MVKVKALFETHLTVSNLERSIDFYRDIVGLELAHTVPDRHLAFFWIGGRGTSMLGLWSIHSAPISTKLHLAFTVDLAQVLAAPDYLRSKNVEPLGFAGAPNISEPVVFPWMPAASVYFNDPDGHSLEYIAFLDDQPRPDIPQVKSWNEWQAIRR
ncbi:VOC family protein [Agrobacterium tumefaciens]|uniref:VOC family protein n=1 Tax=Agrobacterium tumefaciens TaxID=358 RepID=UPI00287EE1F4|nr:VOC family protein [Agrobacterium tumefaciens]MDS7596516.1 VOC family protein [Agrobacterium tumefaciens]